MTDAMKPQHDLDAGRTVTAKPAMPWGHGFRRAPVCFIDPTAHISDGVTVWHFAVILQDVVLENGVMIGSGTEIGRGSRIGARSRVGSNVFLPSNSVLGEDVFIGPNVTCTDDRHPRVAKPGDAPYDARPPIIDDGAAIGAAAIILPGIRIGKGAMVAAGAIVTKDVAPGAMVRCEPARTHVAPDGWRPVNG